MRVKSTTFAFLMLTSQLILIHTSKAASVEFESGLIYINSTNYHQQGTLKVSGPEGFYRELNLSEGQASLPIYELGLDKDGLYSYELLLVQVNGEELINEPVNGRENTIRKKVNAEKVSGNFRLSGGSIIRSVLEPGQENIKKEQGGKHEH